MAVAVATEFNLRHLILACVEEGGDNSTAAIAERLAECVPEEYLREALRTTAPGFIRNIVSPPLRTSKQRGSAHAGSAKWDEAGAYYREIMAGLVQPMGRAKRLGDCQQADLVALARERKRQADDFLKRGQQYLQLAAALKKAKVETVAGLPEKTVLEIFEN